jgi:hypothetical protein
MLPLILKSFLACSEEVGILLPFILFVPFTTSQYFCSTRLEWLKLAQNTSTLLLPQIESQHITSHHLTSLNNQRSNMPPRSADKKERRRLTQVCYVVLLIMAK